MGEDMKFWVEQTGFEYLVTEDVKKEVFERLQSQDWITGVWWEDETTICYTCLVEEKDILAKENPIQVREITKKKTISDILQQSSHSLYIVEELELEPIN